MENNTILSVIVPVYNVERWINRCIESIINQTYRKLEIILIDDGSTDSSGNICDEFQMMDNRVVVYHKNNEGSAIARNYGIEHCRGEYVTFVDSDDWIEPQMYEKLLDLAQEHNTVITGCATMTDFEDGTSNNTFKDREEGMLTGKTCILDILYQTKYAWGQCTIKYIRENCLNQFVFLML